MVTQTVGKSDIRKMKLEESIPELIDLHLLPTVDGYVLVPLDGGSRIQFVTETKVYEIAPQVITSNGPHYFVQNVDGVKRFYDILQSKDLTVNGIAPHREDIAALAFRVTGEDSEVDSDREIHLVLLGDANAGGRHSTSAPKYRRTGKAKSILVKEIRVV